VPLLRSKRWPRLLAVCTNKREYLMRKLLEALGLQHYFHSVAGRETFAVSKPHPGHLTQVITLADGVPSRAIMAARPRPRACPRSW
jgi:phosphoglycolate phosphatase